MRAADIAEALGVSDLARGKSKKVRSPLRNERTASLEVKHTTGGKWLFNDFGHDGDTFEALRDHFAGNANGRPASRGFPDWGGARRTLDNIEDLSPLEWFAAYTGVPRDLWEVLGCDEDERNVLFDFLGIDARKVRKKGAKGMRWEGTASPPIWPVPEDTLPKTIALAEGESDCGVLRHVGIHAFTPTKGAQGVGDSGINADVLGVLMERGAEQVIVFADADSGGRAFRASVIASAQAVGLACAYVDIAPYCDVTRAEKDVRALYRKFGKRKFLRIVAEQTVGVEGQRPYLDRLDDLLAWADEDVDWLIQELVIRGTKTLIAAPTKSLKTWLILHLIACCATCSPLFGVDAYAIPRPVRVLLVEEEGERQMFGRRVRKILNGIDRAVQVEPVFRFRRGFNLLDHSQVTDLITSIAEEQIDVVVLDPLQRITPGVDENSNSDMRRVWDAVNRIVLEHPQVAVIVVAHNRKGDDLGFDAVRGASLSAGEQDLGIFLRKSDDFMRGASTYRGTLAVTLEGRELPQEYTKEGGAMEVEYVLDNDADSFVMRATGDVVVTLRPSAKKRGQANESAVYEAVCDLFANTSQGVTKDEVRRATGLAPRTVEKHLATLTRAGDLNRREVPQEKGGVKAVWEVSGAV